jgi:hypothetical protein
LKQSLPRTKVTVFGVDFNVEYEHHPFICGDLEQPDEPEFFEIYGIKPVDTPENNESLQGYLNENESSLDSFLESSELEEAVHDKLMEDSDDPYDF